MHAPLTHALQVFRAGEAGLAGGGRRTWSWTAQDSSVSPVVLVVATCSAAADGRFCWVYDLQSFSGRSSQTEESSSCGGLLQLHWWPVVRSCEIRRFLHPFTLLVFLESNREFRSQMDGEGRTWTCSLSWDTNLNPHWSIGRALAHGKDIPEQGRAEPDL